MGSEFKAKILQAIDQAIAHCNESSDMIDDPLVLGRLHALGRSLSEQRLEIAGLQDEYPPDDDFRTELTQHVDILSRRMNACDSRKLRSD